MVWKTEDFVGYTRKSLLDFKGKEFSCQIVQMGVTPKGQKLSGGCCGTQETSCEGGDAK